jgi:hypothetical protein
MIGRAPQTLEKKKKEVPTSSQAVEILSLRKQRQPSYNELDNKAPGLRDRELRGCLQH